MLCLTPCVVIDVVVVVQLVCLTKSLNVFPEIHFGFVLFILECVFFSTKSHHVADECAQHEIS